MNITLSSAERNMITNGLHAQADKFNEAAKQYKPGSDEFEHYIAIRESYEALAKRIA